MEFEHLRTLALSLPEVTEAPHHASTSFRVRGKIFLTSPPGGEYLHCFVDETTREQALALHPLFVEKLLWGGKVAGIRLLLANASPAVVRALIRKAWECKAPSALLKMPAVQP